MVSVFVEALGKPEAATALGALLTSLPIVFFASSVASKLIVLGERTGALGASLASYGFILLGAAVVFRALGLIFAWYLGSEPVFALAAAILLIAGFVGEALGAATVAVGVLYATGYTRLSGVWLIVAVLSSLVTTVYAAFKGNFTYFVAINAVVEAPSFLAAASVFHESWRRGNSIDQFALLGFLVAAVAPVAASVAALFGVAAAMITSNLLLMLALMYVSSWSNEMLKSI